ncbi:MAG: BACON domain-containing protein [Paludibacteraceae bacterium]|nr:BACON domain-containing protein [Paludibacteraceae bacterium]
MKFNRTLLIGVILLLFAGNTFAFTINYTCIDSIFTLDSLGRVVRRYYSHDDYSDCDAKTGALICRKKTDIEYKTSSDRNNYEKIIKSQYIWNKDSDRLPIKDSTRIVYDKNDNMLLDEIYFFDKYSERKPQLRIERTYNKYNDVLSELIFDRDNDKMTLDADDRIAYKDTLLSEKLFYSYNKSGQLVTKDDYCFSKYNPNEYSLLHTDYYYDCDERSVQFHYVINIKLKKHEPYLIGVKTSNPETKEELGAVYAWDNKLKKRIIHSLSERINDTWMKLESVYNFQSQSWIPSLKEVSIYNANNKIVADTIFKIISNGQCKKELTTYTYNSRGNLLSKITSCLDSTCGGNPCVNSDYEIMYDSAQRVISRTSMYYSHNQQESASKEIYQYDPNGRLSLSVSARWDNFAHQFIDEQKNEYLPDSTIINSAWDYSKKELRPKEKTRRQYSPNGTLHFETKYTWNDTTNAWNTNSDFTREYYITKHKVEINLLTDTLNLDALRREQTIQVTTDKPITVSSSTPWIHVLTKRLDGAGNVQILVEGNEYHSHRHGEIKLKISADDDMYKFTKITVNQAGAK